MHVRFYKSTCVIVFLALQEQTLEQLTAEQHYQEHLRRVRHQEEVDAEVAKKVSREMNSAEREHQRYEATRDELFAKRIQNLELQNALKSREPLLRDANSNNSSPANTVLRRPEPQNTPPLPVMPNGDVPQHQQQQQQQSFLDLRGGLRSVSYTHLTLPTTPYV